MSTRKKRVCAPAPILALLTVLALLLLFAQGAAAKTLESAKGETIFFYAQDADGRAVLLKILTLDELKERAHGQLSDFTSGSDTGENYYISSTDNYPTTQYCEARGITVPELVDYVKSVTSAPGASSLGFSGADAIRLMATDSYGNYNRSWTYDELYGVKRYYFEGLFDERAGWKTAWEIAGEDDSKFGLSLSAYNANYRDSDPYYAEKRAVFEGGVLTVPILATQSYSGRTTSSTLVASTEIGIADDIAKNGGTVAGSLTDKLSDDWSLRLSLPMTEADLMAAHRTAFDNFKWIYNLKLDMERAPAAFRAAGTVAEPLANASVTGDTLSFTVSCATPNAEIFYAFDGAPQTPYTGPVTVDVKGRDLAADPVTFYITAVREGYADAGVVTVKYPGLSPAFKTVYSAPAGEPLSFAAADGVASSDWKAYIDAFTFVSIKTPGAGGYTRVDAEKYKADAASKTIAFDKSLLSESGSYSFIFHARGYADKAVSLTVKKAAPAVTVKGAQVGRRIVFTFEDADYGDGISLYVTPQGGESTIISSTMLDRTRPGRVILKAAYFAGASCPVRTPGAYTFSLVNSRFEPGTVDVNASLSAGETARAADDVTPTAWYYDAALYVTAEGLFDMQQENAFGPGDPMTRAMLVVALHRLEGAPAAAPADFTDVARDAPSAEAVSWANDAGIVNGMGDGVFAPDAGITREQFAAMLYRYAQYKGADLSAKGDLSAFTDEGRVSAFAREALAWANGEGFVNGMGDGTLAPQGGTTRAQAATMLMNLYDAR